MRGIFFPFQLRPTLKTPILSLCKCIQCICFSDPLLYKRPAIEISIVRLIPPPQQHNSLFVFNYWMRGTKLQVNHEHSSVHCSLGLSYSTLLLSGPSSGKHPQVTAASRPTCTLDCCLVWGPLLKHLSSGANGNKQLEANKELDETQEEVITKEK